eukprot:TRINITY_DN8615_c0_g1_i8.p1 TRINITY_DN8615_c0_g1~~TRINITY_DN8615_c0_g1_i8.p1  ORF type:complete len:377 (+),score=52.98 TRINITY_DN8615_c0_g1_i8:34-1131(+)
MAVREPQNQPFTADFGVIDLKDKIKLLRESYDGLLDNDSIDFQTIPQPPHGSRYRCLFQIIGPPFRYARRNDGQPQELESGVFPLAASRIQDLMPALLEQLELHPPLSEGIRVVNFHTTLAGETLIALSYGQPRHQDWRPAAIVARDAMQITTLIGRSKGERECVDQSYVVERFPLTNNDIILLQQEEGVFCNPSPVMALHTMQWLVESARMFGATDMNLLELYSGAGSYTPAMCTVFQKVHSIEIQRPLVEAARRNLELNGCQDKATVTRAPVEECRKVLWNCAYNDVKFDAVLLDPPRDGLDDFTRSKIHQFKVVMLISCNPRHKLLLDIQTLLPTHDLKRYVVLDHFPGTSHLECAAVLVKR